MPEAQFTPEELDRLIEASEDAHEWHAKAEPIILAGSSGSLPCWRCQADAAWHREGRNWSITCPVCNWSAAGMFPMKVN